MNDFKEMFNTLIIALVVGFVVCFITVYMYKAHETAQEQGTVRAGIYEHQPQKTSVKSVQSVD